MVVTKFEQLQSRQSLYKIQSNSPIFDFTPSERFLHFVWQQLILQELHDGNQMWCWKYKMLLGCSEPQER